MTAAAPSLVDAYEQLRAMALGAQPICGPGLSTLRRQGMVAWIRTASITPDPMPRPYRRLLTVAQSPPSFKTNTLFINDKLG